MTIIIFCRSGALISSVAKGTPTPSPPPPPCALDHLRKPQHCVAPLHCNSSARRAASPGRGQSIPCPPALTLQSSLGPVTQPRGGQWPQEAWNIHNASQSSSCRETVRKAAHVILSDPSWMTADSRRPHDGTYVDSSLSQSHWALVIWAVCIVHSSTRQVDVRERAALHTWAVFRRESRLPQELDREAFQFKSNHWKACAQRLSVGY